jgi:hypothetical protein
VEITDFVPTNFVFFGILIFGILLSVIMATIASLGLVVVHTVDRLGVDILRPFINAMGDDTSFRTFPTAVNHQGVMKDADVWYSITLKDEFHRLHSIVLADGTDVTEELSTTEYTRISDVAVHDWERVHG